jgi:uncharacterized protein
MTDNAPARPAPSMTEPDTGPFWLACRDHRLTYQVCQECEGTVFFRRQHCPRCGSDRLQDRDSAGRGVLYSYTVIRQHGHPFFRSDLPYLVGIVDLEEGFRMLAPIRVIDMETLQVGQRVGLEWEDHDDWSLPIFRTDPQPS